MYVGPSEATKYFKVSRDTLRRWADEGKVKVYKSKGGHRRYWIGQEEIETVHKAKEKINIFQKKKFTDTLIYGRVSSSKQRFDLERQIKQIENYCQEKKYNYQTITDIASGINFKRKGLQKILDIAIQGNLKRIVVAHKDRLARIGFDLIETILSKYGTVIDIIETENSNGESEIKEDIISIITHYTAKFYGSRKYNVYG